MRKYLVGAAARGRGRGAGHAGNRAGRHGHGTRTHVASAARWRQRLRVRQNWTVGSGYDGGKPSADDFHMDIGASLTFTGTGTTDGGLTATAVIVSLTATTASIDESHLTSRAVLAAINIGKRTTMRPACTGTRAWAAVMAAAATTHGGQLYTGELQGRPRLPAAVMLSASGTARPASADSRRAFRSSLKPVQTTATTVAANDSNMIAVGANFSGDFAGTSITVWRRSRFGIRPSRQRAAIP